jgi:hypothetical protein
MNRFSESLIVIPAKAGIHPALIPAFAGMTEWWDQVENT